MENRITSIPGEGDTVRKQKASTRKPLENLIGKERFGTYLEEYL